MGAKVAVVWRKGTHSRQTSDRAILEKACAVRECRSARGAQISSSNPEVLHSDSVVLVMRCLVRALIVTRRPYVRALVVVCYDSTASPAIVGWWVVGVCATRAP